MFALIPSITKCHGSITSKSIFLPLQQESTVDKKSVLTCHDPLSSQTYNRV